MWGVGLLALLIGSVREEKGTVSALFVIAFISFFLYRSEIDSLWWHIGCNVSLALSVVIFSLMHSEQRAMWSQQMTQLEQQNTLQAQLEEDLKELDQMHKQSLSQLQGRMVDLQKELEDVGAKEGSLALLNDVLRQTCSSSWEREKKTKTALEDKEQAFVQLQGELFLARQRIEVLQQEPAAREKQEWVDLLNQARLEKAQAVEISRHMATVLSEELSGLKEKVPCHELIELRKQFVEKKKILEETRAALFILETERLAETKKDRAPHFQQEVDLLWEQIQSLETENEFLRQECDVMTETISQAYQVDAGKAILKTAVQVEAKKKSLVPASQLNSSK
jgi:uncharacterized protein Veg